MKYWVLSLCCWVLSSCVCRPEKINLDASVRGRGEQPLSKVVSSLEYVQLASPGDSVNLECTSLIFADDAYMLMSSSRDPLLLFDRKGKFLNYIGKDLSGPGSDLHRYAYIDRSVRQIVLFGTRTIRRFDFSGNVLSCDTLSLPDGDASRSFVFGGRDGRLVAFDMSGDSCSVLRLPAGGGGHTSGFPGRYAVQFRSQISVSPEGKVSRSTGRAPFIDYRADYAAYYDGSRYFRFYYNGRVCPVYDLSLSYAQEGGGNALFHSFCETGRFLFMEATTLVRYKIIYLKDEKKAYCLEPKSRGLVNDIDFFYPFWPDGVTADGMLFMRSDARILQRYARWAGDSRALGFADKFLDNAAPVLIFAMPKR